MYVNPVSNVFHGLTKYRVVHEFEEVLLEVIVRLGSEIGVQISSYKTPVLAQQNYNLPFTSCRKTTGTKMSFTSCCFSIGQCDK